MKFAGLFAILGGITLVCNAVDFPVLPFDRWPYTTKQVTLWATAGEVLFLVGVLMMLFGGVR